MRSNLAKPQRRAGTSVLQFVKRIPADILPLIKGKTIEVPCGGRTMVFTVGDKTQAIRFSLGTADPRVAKLRQLEALSYVEQWLEAQRHQQPIPLSHRERTALVGELYAPSSQSGPDDTIHSADLRADVARGSLSQPHMDEEEEAEFFRGFLESQKEPRDPLLAPHTGLYDAQYRANLQARLDAKGIAKLEDESFELLLTAYKRMHLVNAPEAFARLAEADYSPDPLLAKFPKWQGPELDPTLSRRQGLRELVDLWWAEAKQVGRTETTRRKYALTFRLLSEFLGHNDALKVTPSDIVRFKDFRLTAINPRLGKSLSATSFKAGDMIALKSVFKWVTENGHIPMDPAASLKVRAARRVKLRERDFTEAEAKALLKATATAPFRSDPKPVKRWVPWLCAYSGCRVGEAMQLRKQDFRKEHGTWVMTITPEAGTVKGKELREVPVHEHVIEKGFAEFLEGAAEGYLFMFNPKDNPFPLLIKTELEKLRRFARRIVKDPNVGPNHAWRHSFKSRGFEVGIQEKVLDAICGHTPASVGRAYGSVSLKTKIDAMKRFPRYSIE